MLKLWNKKLDVTTFQVIEYNLIHVHLIQLRNLGINVIINGWKQGLQYVLRKENNEKYKLIMV